MAFDDSDLLAASKLISEVSEKKLKDLLREYGEERRAGAIARAIKTYGGIIETTGQLARIIRSTVGERSFVKTAARVFQALRIKVNREFENITKGLDEMLPLIAPGGRALVITYHSLEDHLVRKIFKKFSGKCICPPKMPECRCGKVELFRSVTEQPLIPEDKEVALNPRARSAKLRVVERIAVEA
jgi:16S rRNA (cytosine1402-N4)-methyltransferase